jgi:hypothetical protein
MANLGYDNGSNFIKALSSFWTVVYRDRDLLNKFMSGYGELFSDAYFNFLETVLSSKIEDIPVFNKKKWFFLTLLESENLADSRIIYSSEGIDYGRQPEDALFNPGGFSKYGGTFNADSLYRWKLPREVVDIDRFLMNRIHSPSTVLTKGTDFIIEEFEGVKVITFSKNPFEDKTLAKREIRSTQGVVTDTEVGIWALNSYWDYELVWNNYGKLINFYRPNSTEYRTFVQAIWDLFVGGPSYTNLEAGVNAVLGLPISRDNETISEIVDDGTDYNIITDLNVYKVNNSVSLRSDFFSNLGLLKPNITLKPFEPLTEVIELKDSISHPQWWEGVDPLVIPRNLLHDDVSFYLPPGIKVYADTVIGNTFGLPSVHKAPNQFLQTLGLRVGEWVIGEDSPGVPLSYSFDYKNYIMENFFKENLFFLSISPSVALLPSFQRQVVNIIFEAIPAYTTFINYTFLETFLNDFPVAQADQYLLESSTFPLTEEVGFDGKSRIKGHNSPEEVMTVGNGVPLSEEADSSTSIGYDSSTTLGYTLGYYGYPYLGKSVTIGSFGIGNAGFQSGILVRSICGN